MALLLKTAAIARPTCYERVLLGRRSKKLGLAIYSTIFTASFCGVRTSVTDSKPLEEETSLNCSIKVNSGMANAQ